MTESSSVSPTEFLAVAALIRRLDPTWRLVRAWPLTGGVSARVTALDVLLPDGQRREFVLREHGPADVAANAHVAADEFRLLAHLHAAGLPVPKPVAYEDAATGAAASAIVLERLAGASTPAPADSVAAARQMAAFLARLHALADVPTFLPDATARIGARLGQTPAHIDAALSEGEIRAALTQVWPLPLQHAPVLLHGDFWPGNVLWQDGRLTGVIDWEDAARGDPLADVANARLELLWAWGPAAMAAFTAGYLAAAPVDAAHLPYWDLCAALRPAGKLSSWGLDVATARTMRDQHRWFVTQAFANLNKPPQHA
ncbi:MAG: phosphotransferase [Caldilineaceae bacterium]|nr:phosphotransferase [Caldilineaceae bacterium]